MYPVVGAAERAEETGTEQPAAKMHSVATIIANADIYLFFFMAVFFYCTVMHFLSNT